MAGDDDDDDLIKLFERKDNQLTQSRALMYYYEVWMLSVFNNDGTLIDRNGGMVRSGERVVVYRSYTGNWRNSTQ